MPRYIVERELEDAGNLSGDELQAISQKSCSVLEKLGPQIQWVQSFVTKDKLYCIYISPNEQLIKKHADLGELPLNAINEVMTIIDPVTAE
ncbi:DUF4242 domain-containing protein [Christiangramia crocea]|uniref:DUF4242 domain-containing protein n=1 Tax=Christiangramia crocea TaxID=2904124 RepID=A0A9X1UWH1_9FLAO|nr:DUF4242 domain-containing protein [Gramella crocea]MCG9971707.1 DUF4242 domain-containing protein [Gramella crocea]